MTKRSSGVLMHISSLPGRWGIGKFGKSAISFARLLKSAGFSSWQVLPLHPLGQGDSPYMAISAFAGYIGFIDPEYLVADGFLRPYELSIFEYSGGAYLTDYDFAYSKAYEMLKFAYLRLDAEKRAEMLDFSEKNKHWLDDYALYMSLREKYGNRGFLDWPDRDLALRKKESLRSAFSDQRESVDFWKFTQYIFYKQWGETKASVNEEGIKIIGDMPIYVSLDSSDVWSHPEIFKLDENLNPSVSAGVPPDYFAPEGQLWGNPIYNWKELKSSDYSWWVKRMAFAMENFDSVRLDHFRGLQAYWEVPYGEKSAINGKWVSGPGLDFIETLKEQIPCLDVIAEDLGIIDDEVVHMRVNSGFPGMKVLQFGFNSRDDNLNLPHNYEKNSVAYCGTHDNNTMLGWLWEANEGDRDFALSYSGFKGDWGKGGPNSPSVSALVRSLWQSPSKLVIISIQDICGYGSDARMNVPGVPSGNWRFRITENALFEIPLGDWYKLNKTFMRLDKVNKK